MSSRTRSTRRAIVYTFVGIICIAALAFFFAPHASEAPDGLEKVSADQGIASTAEEHPFGGSPLADYSLRGVEDDRLSTSLAGAIGVVLTFVVSGAAFALIRRRHWNSS
jgi:cobalt/nickel transport system permease protein